MIKCKVLPYLKGLGINKEWSISILLLDIFCVILYSDLMYITYQKLPVKVGSWSETIEWGMPWSLKILSMNIWANVDVLNRCWRAHKWTYLERKSTTTMMNDLLSDLGSPTMKSIEISHQIEGGIGRGSSVLGALKVSCLLGWQMSHSTTKVRTSYLISS